MIEALYDRETAPDTGPLGQRANFFGRIGASA